MILTFKVRHDRDFSNELKKAKQVADYAVKTKSRTSKDVKHIGLKSMISNQILKKYSSNKKIKSVKSVNLIVPNQGIKVNKDLCEIIIPCLKLNLNYQFKDFEKVNQIEIDRKFAFISVTFQEEPLKEVNSWIGVDLNTTGHTVVIADPVSGKIKKLGKKAEHIHKKYKNIRKDLQKNGKYGKVKQIKDRESRVVRDLNHKMSKEVVNVANENNSGIKLEQLKNIRKNAKSSRSFRYSLNSWSFYQLNQMIEYKAKLLGIPVTYIDPKYTSQECSICGLIGNRNDKLFKCPHCGHVDHADVNAAFNIALRSDGIGQSIAERDVMEGCTDTPKMAMVHGSELTIEPHVL
jgi:putative transposase